MPLPRLILVDRGKEFCDVLRWQFRSHPEVEIVFGKFEDLPAFECVITAGDVAASRHLTLQPIAFGLVGFNEGAEL
jgi:hypothetical protein